ncbi:MAG: hypothetical protein V4615_06540 [Bacteroidota bacterium]
MKHIKYITLILVALMMTANLSHAQAWEKNTKVLSLGFGASQFFHIDNYYYSGHPGRGARGWYWPVTGQINFQGEFGIHKYVGLGFTTGLGGRGPMLYGYNGEINVPIGLIANFHFYQLIADKTGKNIHADKLDIYAGVNVGSGIAASFYRDPYDAHAFTRISPIAFGGVQLGLRYYFKPKVGVNAEVGFGKSIVNVGFVFKL